MLNRFTSEVAIWKRINLMFISVCVTFLGKFIDSLDSETKGSQEKVEAAFRKMCKTAKKDDNRLVSTVDRLIQPLIWLHLEMGVSVLFMHYLADSSYTKWFYFLSAQCFANGFLRSVWTSYEVFVNLQVWKIAFVTYEVISKYYHLWSIVSLSGCRTILFTSYVNSYSCNTRVSVCTCYHWFITTRSQTVKEQFHHFEPSWNCYWV